MRIVYSRSLSTTAACLSGSASAIPISVPLAIKRKPTDLLEAISKTVGVDKTAPHFSFIDDPTTIPTTAQAKRTYFLAKELGRRSARQLAKEWPTLFMYDQDQPRLEIFRPKPMLSEYEATEENLKYLIEEKDVVEALNLYQQLSSQNQQLQEETLFDLFRLTVYYNGKSSSMEELSEWHGLRAFVDSGDKSWQIGGMAELLFEMLPHNEEVVSIMIAGLGKYPSQMSLERARSLFNEAVEKKQVLTQEAFDVIVRNAEGWDSAVKVLENMAALKVRPGVSTFNGLLEALRMGMQDSSKTERVHSVLAEMRRLSVNPNLTTFNLCLMCLNNTKEDQITLLHQILNVLEELPATVAEETTDGAFFITAMSTATRLNNAELVDRVERLYSSKRKNMVALNALTEEPMFYSRFLNYKIEQLPSDQLEKLYKELVPRVVGVTPTLISSIANKIIDSGQHWSLTSRVIEDAIVARHMFDQKISGTIRKLLLTVSSEALPAEQFDEYEALVHRIVDIWIEIGKFTQERAKGLQIKLSPSTIGECALLLSRTSAKERCWDMLSLLLNEEAKKGKQAYVSELGYPHINVMNQLFDTALKEGDWENASLCLQIIAVFLPNVKLEQYVARIEEKSNINSLQKRILTNFIRLRA
ncbi:hypothetical protein QR680_009618 [Steinernema hermaphroditum]|uniref:Small ribosomal subunit protein mS39 n=1 Tax=Steinernema hermaphroditum TaxID=289476 RepID=A0AA39MAA4_9BILA|nr:hypothetical protein QR680_009618 [Steinernema hermaphroditum]